MTNKRTSNKATSSDDTALPDFTPSEVEGDSEGLGAHADAVQPLPEFSDGPTPTPSDESPSMPQAPLVDPTPIDVGPALVEAPTVSVRIVRNEASVLLGSGHYTLSAGTTMVLPQPVADELVARKLAEYI